MSETKKASLEERVNAIVAEILRTGDTIILHFVHFKNVVNIKVSRKTLDKDGLVDTHYLSHKYQIKKANLSDLIETLKESFDDEYKVEFFKSREKDVELGVFEPKDN